MLSSLPYIYIHIHLCGYMNSSTRRRDKAINMYKINIYINEMKVLIFGQAGVREDGRLEEGQTFSLLDSFDSADLFGIEFVRSGSRYGYNRANRAAATPKN